jgi:hypothetical protein
MNAIDSTIVATASGHATAIRTNQARSSRRAASSDSSTWVRTS